MNRTSSHPEKRTDVGIVLLTEPQSAGITTGTVPLEYAMVIQTMPPTVSEDDYCSTPAFIRKNTESDIYILLPTPEGDAQRYRPFRCVLNPTGTDGSRRAPEWLGPEQALPPVSMRKILGVLLIGRRVDGSAGHEVGGSTRVSLGFGESSSDAAAHDLKKMKLGVLSEAISRDYRTRTNKVGRGEEVWAYDVTDAEPEDETTLIFGLRIEEGMGLPSVYLQRMPCTA